MALELRGVTHPGLERWLQWDLRRAPEVVAELLPRVQDRDLRGRVERATAAAWERVSTVADQLPLQAIHGDLTDDNLVATAGPDGRPVITGVIDFGDLAYGWRVAELVVGLITVLHHADAGPASVLPAVRAFHERVRLDDAEIAALWPLVVLRGAVLVVSGHSQITIDPENAYAASGSIGERAMFEAATSVPHEVMHQLVRSALGLPGATRTPPTSVVPMTDAVPLVVDLSPTSALLDAGRWTASDVEQQLVAAGDAVLRHGEPRLSRTPPLSLTEPETVAVGCTLVTREPLELRAPWDVTVSDSDGVLRLAGPGGTVLVRGAEPGRGGARGRRRRRRPRAGRCGRAPAAGARPGPRAATVHHRVAGARLAGCLRGPVRAPRHGSGFRGLRPGPHPGPAHDAAARGDRRGAGALLRRRAAAVRAGLARPDGRRRRPLVRRHGQQRGDDRPRATRVWRRRRPGSGAAEHELAVQLQPPSSTTRADGRATLPDARHRVPRQLRVRGGRPGTTAGEGAHGSARRHRDQRGLPRLDRGVRRRLHLARTTTRSRTDPPRLGPHGAGAQQLPWCLPW